MTTSPANRKPSFFPDFQAKVERSNRWVRVKFGGETVADSKHPLLLIQYGPGSLPTYYFAASEVRQDLLEPGSKSEQGNGKEFFNLKAGAKTAENAAWIYRDPPESLSALKDYYSFKWNAMDAWYEEEEEIYAHARDPYKRVDVMPSSRHVQVIINGVTVADTHRPTLLFETYLPIRYYIPQEDVKMDLLQPSPIHTRCPYKGLASYWSVQAGDTFARNIAWAYPDPIAENPKIKGLICFYNEKVDLIIDGEKAERPITPFS
jgi:uncharacterized protein (DUF427 family)